MMRVVVWNGNGWAAEIRDQKSEVRGQRSEVRATPAVPVQQSKYRLGRLFNPNNLASQSDVANHRKLTVCFTTIFLVVIRLQGRSDEY
jgi:hypothetical protein